MSQLGYVHQISSLQIAPERRDKNKLPIDEEERSKLRSLGGQLLWVSSQTRPDVAYGTCMATNSYASGTITELKQANKTVKTLKDSPLKVKFPGIKLDKASIVVFSDASFANLPDGSSQGGYLVFIADDSG